MFFRWISIKRELTEVKQELDQLKAAWRQVQQEWDATADRVTKVLRRIRRAEQAQAAAGTDDTGQQPSLPLTSVPTAGTRMDRIKAQMAGRAPIQKED